MDGQCEGIMLAYDRGPPFIGYEPPVCDVFQKKYDVDPRHENHPEWYEFRAGYMTQLLVDLRTMLEDESAKQSKRIKLVAVGYGSEAGSLECGLAIREWVRRGLVDVFMAYPTTGFGGELDRTFYREMRVTGKVKLIIGGMNAREYEKVKEQYLDDFDGLVMGGCTSSQGLETAHPSAREGTLSISDALPPVYRSPAPGEETARFHVEWVQGMHVNVPHFGSGY